MNNKIRLLLGLLALLWIESCSQPRQPTRIDPVAPPSIARYVGSDLAREVPSSLVPIAIKALDLLYSDEALRYTLWPEALRGYPPKGPFKAFSVERMDAIGQPDVVHVFLLESDPRNGRSFSVYWNTEYGKCGSIDIAVP